MSRLFCQKGRHGPRALGNAFRQTRHRQDWLMLRCTVASFAPWQKMVPLAAQTKDTFRRVLLSDAGRFHALLRMPIADAFPRWDSLAPHVRGQLVEQLVGQHLRLMGPLSGDGPELYYWQRDGGRPGEIDHVVQNSAGVVPVELKAGAAGSMKSLHQFMFDRGLRFAVRFDENSHCPLDTAIYSSRYCDGDTAIKRTFQCPPLSHHVVAGEFSVNSLGNWRTPVRLEELIVPGRRRIWTVEATRCVHHDLLM